MENSRLTASAGNGGSPYNTQNPQTAGQGNAGGTKSSSVQPGTSVNLLNNGAGVSLHSEPLTTVNLSNPTTTTTTAITKPAAKPHHVNATLLSLPVILIVIALGSFWFISRTAKTTT